MSESLAALFSQEIQQKRNKLLFMDFQSRFTDGEDVVALQEETDSEFNIT